MIDYRPSRQNVKLFLREPLTGRPAKNAASEDVYVEVKHRLAGLGVGVDDRAEAGPVDTLLLRQTSCH